jgi:hypothetical protein
MNLNSLENLARGAFKGENTAEKSNNMLRDGLISPVEHRSLQSLSFQIAANVQAQKNEGAMAWIRPTPLTWI